MKKILSYLTALGLFLSIYSCNDEGVLYEMNDGAEASFPSTVINFQMTPEDGNKIVVEMWRGNTKGSVSVPVTIKDETGGVFTPQKDQFDFADGESSAYLTFSYPDLSDFGGEVYKLSLTITDEDQISPSGRDKISISAQRKLTYKSIGTGTFTSEYYGASWAQEVEKAEEANFYRLPNCYEPGFPIVFSMEDGVIGFDIQPMGYNHPDYGMVSWDPRYVDECEVDGKTITFVPAFVVSAGSFGDRYEVLVLP